MAKWLLGIFTAVVTALAVAYLSGILIPKPPPQPNKVVGYLVVNPNGGISSVSQINRNHNICGTKTSMGTARATEAISHAQLTVLPASELYPAFASGICDTVFLKEQTHADQIFPLKLTNFRVIHVMGF